MDFIYVMMYLSIIYYSIHLTHSNKKFIYYIYLFSTLFGLFALTTFVIFFVDVIKGFAGLDTCNLFCYYRFEDSVSEEIEWRLAWCWKSHWSSQVFHYFQHGVIYLAYLSLWTLLFEAEISMGNIDWDCFFLVLFSIIFESLERLCYLQNWWYILGNKGVRCWGGW